MDENEVPEWVLDAMRNADAQMRAVEPYVEQEQRDAETARMMMPSLRYAQEYAEQARQVLEMTRLTWPVVEYMQRHTAQARQALEVAGLLLAYADRVALAADAGLLRSAGRGAVGPRHHTVGASLTITPTFTVHAEVVKAADSNDVEVKPDARPDARRSIDFAALGVQLVIAWALIFPMLLALLPVADQQILGTYIATISIALAVGWRYQDKHKD